MKKTMKHAFKGKVLQSDVEDRVFKCQRRLERNESDYDRGPKEPTARAIRWIKEADKGQLVLRYLVDG